MGRCQLCPFFLLLLAICAIPSVSAQTTSAKKAAVSAEKYPPGLYQEIHHQLLELPFYSVFDFISFTLEGHKVTISGQVVPHTLKNDAEATVKNIEGVSAVVNNIEVLPVSAADDELRREVYRSIYEDPTLARYATQAVPPIHIIVKNSGVSLEGSVTSESDKSLAAVRARNVANVLSVRNNLVVQASESAAK